MDVVLLGADLTVVSRLQGAVSRVSAKLHSVSNVAQAEEFCGRLQPALVIIDLELSNVDLAFVQRLKSGAVASPRVIAFGPHVHKERLAAAEAAGCDVVLSRGAFWAQVDALLTAAAN